MNIQSKIITICDYLRTRYESKKHGGYNIYSDDKIFASTDTYVPNVDLMVILPDNKKEYVFSCSYHGTVSTYHPGKWEDYIEKLYLKALDVKSEKDKEAKRERELKEQAEKAPASKEADTVFN